ncbi:MULTISPECIES: hypothetical protein [Escherichia]|uniref:hypothetical protein n=1 Tax=Escherichia TaxID=561 RepID=UPI000330BA5D|nr:MULTISPECIES: hypothetical protein [Escherichia]EOQ45361.1 hypothetical protein WEW_04341 [Escherichia coli KTE33]EOU78418.1 hypothetical protein WES_03453 [Escherichia sp. KTE31]
MPEEEVKVSSSDGIVCFCALNTEGYRLSDIAIYPMNMPGSRRKYIFLSDFKVMGELCSEKYLPDLKFQMRR